VINVPDRCLICIVSLHKSSLQRHGTLRRLQPRLRADGHEVRLRGLEYHKLDHSPCKVLYGSRRWFHTIMLLLR
jgi:hypothetical protein